MKSAVYADDIYLWKNDLFDQGVSLFYSRLN
jgi:hypothetical protein